MCDTLPKLIPALKADPLAWYRENDIKPPLWLRELASAGDSIQEMEPHELMRLGEEVRRAIAMPGPMARPAPADHMKGSEHGRA